MTFIRTLAAVSLLLMTAGVSHAEPIGVDGARKLPILDTHFHVMDWMDPEELKAKMAEHNVPRWGGTSPRGRFIDYMEKAGTYGDDYIFGTGTSHMAAIKNKAGLESLDKPGHPMVTRFVGLMKKHLASGKVHVVGEIFINTRTSAANPSMRWKIKGDSPGMKAIFAAASDFNVPLMIHAQLDDDTAEQIINLAASRPDGKLVMGHCGKDSSASEVRAIFEKASNVTCNLAYRSPPQEKGKYPERIIWDDSGIKDSWRQLIEEFSDRFMIGIDDTHDWGQFDAVVKTLRDDLLANLSKETAVKVASENARRIYGL